MEENTYLEIGIVCLSLGATFSVSGPLLKSPYEFYFYGISILFYIVYLTTLVIASNREKGIYINTADVLNLIGALFSMIGLFYVSSLYSIFFLIPFVFFVVNICRNIRN